MLACWTTAVVDAVTLTPENWDELTAGKTVFVKFMRSDLGEGTAGKELKPDWDRLKRGG